MSLLKICAVVLSSILVFQTGCDLWCHNAVSEDTPLLAAAVPACHDTDSNDGSGQSPPPGHHEPASDCIHPQAADGKSKFQAKAIKLQQLPAASGLSTVEFGLELQIAAFGVPGKRPLLVLPQASSILRI